ncbi:mitochondrial fission process 1 family protein [Aspergillus homomorphus CBS 101889]|uniref:Mitochondrial fission process protein 1 n=1 Tax=Aspergillus homomorphus (strain CBS 101889) TaxID=1450537 RepID=A0A395I1X5_ASPHC|nr:hypothetical protein BO97DRAFT_342135 [Aspergillus homomorphus CBS 101889]RAL13689.1 hypothetical protein BO97DRAFT_342135 [Aspergillus homomorphus CBS 101889]
MIWGKKEDKAPEVVQQPIPREKLPDQLQKLVDHDDGFYDDIYSSYSVDSTETPYRYAGYATRLRTLLLSAHRYVAYTSDIGESFRPVAHPWLVRSAYGISWTYLIGDVAHEGYKAYLRNRSLLAPPCEAYKDASELSPEQVAKGMITGNLTGTITKPSPDTLTPWPTTHVPLIEDYRMVMAKRAVFQSIASMGLPAFTIHSVVKYSGRAFKNSKSAFMRTWSPIGLGLAIVPFLPYLFDEPVEEAVEWAFSRGLWVYGGDEAVHPLPPPKAARMPQDEATSLSHYLRVQTEKHNNEALGSDASVSDSAANLSWDEYKEERRRAREQRQREREAHGHSGPLSFLKGINNEKKV